MYFDTSTGIKRVMYLPKSLNKKKAVDRESVSVKAAADQVVEFMKKVDSNTTLCHGRDMVTIDAFMGSYVMWN